MVLLWTDQYPLKFKEDLTNLNSPFTRTLANNSGLVEIQLTCQKSLLTLRQLHLRAVKQEDSVTNSSEER